MTKNDEYKWKRLSDSTERLAFVAQEMAESGLAIEQGIIDALHAQLIRWRRATILLAMTTCILIILAISNLWTLRAIDKNLNNTEKIVQICR